MKTLSELQALSDDELRELLANILFPDFPTYWSGDCLRHRYPKGATGPAFNYPADLNACAEVEKGLTCAQTVSYLDHLQDVTRGRFCYPLEINEWMRCALVVHATARQRTIALIWTLQQ